MLDEAVFQVFQVRDPCSHRGGPSRQLLAMQTPGLWEPVPPPRQLPRRERSLFPCPSTCSPLGLGHVCVSPWCPSLPLPSLLFCQDYISKMDPASTLGLSTDSIHGYSISHVRRVLDAEPPEMPPCRRGVNNVLVSLKGQPLSSGVKAWGWGDLSENPQGSMQQLREPPVLIAGGPSSQAPPGYKVSFKCYIVANAH